MIEEPCAECGFDSAALDREQIPARTRSTMAAVAAALQRPGAAQRPASQVWSPLEYACHVRDAARIFELRVGRMLDEDDPLFDNWDQDRTAVEDRYWEQDPGVVATQCVAAADVMAARYESVGGAQWDRPGRRSNGSRFTVESIGRYYLHDLVHHLNDIGSA